jgi:hypothetical protein
MGVLDRLAAIGAGIGDDAMAAGKHLLRKGGRDVQEVAYLLGWDFGYVRVMLLRDDQKVRGCLGVDIREDEAVVVLMKRHHRDGSSADLAEETV